jgi:hypothetical protein
VDWTAGRAQGAPALGSPGGGSRLPGFFPGMPALAGGGGASIMPLRPILASRRSPAVRQIPPGGRPVSIRIAPADHTPRESRCPKVHPDVKADSLKDRHPVSIVTPPPRLSPVNSAMPHGPAAFMIAASRPVKNSAVFPGLSCLPCPCHSPQTQRRSIPSFLMRSKPGQPGQQRRSAAIFRRGRGGDLKTGARAPAFFK